MAGPPGIGIVRAAGSGLVQGSKGLGLGLQGSTAQP
jgi:hypothetical protein